MAVRSVRPAAFGGAVLQDLSGPKIRIGRVPVALALQDGGTLSIERGRFDGKLVRGGRAPVGGKDRQTKVCQFLRKGAG